MRLFKTVLGNIPESDLGITLAHEHICCYSEYAYRMAKKAYLDKERLARVASAYLKEMKEKFALSTFVDCTPINLGRDIELLRRVSDASEVNIVCATGFYYTREPVLYKTSENALCGYMLSDAASVNAGVIKCAVEDATVDDFCVKLLRASAMAHRETGLPIVLHTNAKNQNARAALAILLEEGVCPRAISVGHLSDTDSMVFIQEIASLGCYIGLDRLYENASEEYVSRKVQTVEALAAVGFEKQILLSHDALFFNGFDAEPLINEKPRFSYCFSHILPKLPQALAERIKVENPKKMLGGR